MRPKHFSQFGLLAGYSNMTIPSNTTNGPVFGGFLGYNVQWDQLVVGFDLGYKYPSVLDSIHSAVDI